MHLLLLLRYLLLHELGSVLLLLLLNWMRLLYKMVRWLLLDLLLQDRLSNRLSNRLLHLLASLNGLLLNLNTNRVLHDKRFLNLQVKMPIITIDQVTIAQYKSLIEKLFE